MFSLLRDDVPEVMTDVSVMRASRRAMATLFEVMIPIGADQAEPAAMAALDLIDDLEEQLTVYRDDSEVSQLNQTAKTGYIPLEQQLFSLIETAAHLSRQTDGAFDIATGALIKAWGFFQRQGKVPSPLERSEAISRSGSRYLALDRSSKSVKYLRDGLEINLGGIGKGYALDRAGLLLRSRYQQISGLLHGGSSSVLAIGHPPTQSRGWPVAIRHPWDQNRRLGIVYLNSQGMGTSAATFQHFEYNGKKLGHLIDPRTGWPAEGIQQVSVIAPTAMEADALSTAFFVLGLEGITRYCKTRPDVGAIVLPDGVEQPTTFNVTSQTFTLSPD